MTFAAAPLLLRFHFSADDYEIISASLSKAFPVAGDFVNSPTGFLYRPLVTLSFALNFLISGWEPWSYLLFNIFLHGINAFLCARVVARLTPAGKNLPLFAGMIFFVMPQGLANVYWISGRSDILCFAATAGAFLLSWDYWTSGRVWPIAGSMILFVLALMSKESGLLFLLYLTIVPVLSFAGIGEQLSRRRIWHSVSAAGCLTVGYFLFRYATFGFLVGNQASDQEMNVRRMLDWIVHALWSPVAPFDPVDVLSFSSANLPLFALAVLPVIVFVAAFAHYAIRTNNKSRLHIVVLCVGALFSTAIYLRSFPGGRLSYLVLPLLIAAVSLAFKPVLQNRLAQGILVLYVLSLAAASALLAYKYERIARIERSAQESLKGYDGSVPDTLFVLGQICRIGQNWVASSMSIEYSPYRISPQRRASGIEVVNLGTFEGTILTNWTNPYTITLRADTIILTSLSSFSGFVPRISRKFSAREIVRAGGIAQLPGEFSALRNGVARELRIAPLPDQRVQIVFYKDGRFTRLPCSEFRRLFSTTTSNPAAEE